MFIRTPVLTCRNATPLVAFANTSSIFPTSNTSSPNRQKQNTSSIFSALGRKLPPCEDRR